MSKLLVNAPSGAQELLTVGPGGGYFDSSRVLWDEREDGRLPEITFGGMVRNGNALVFSQARMDEHMAATRPPVPQSVTRRQAKQALALNNLLHLVQPAIDAITDETQRTLMQIEWADSQEFHRNRPALIGLATALGLTSEQLDSLFVQAAAL
ncbi:MAG: hypothetical protein LCH79_15180 [Proteobacteria bacterium]|nr:hypothetical protein [Pseudomonadota bacterium]